MAVGRFAPSPSGPLHLGNLRTAMLAWLFARSSGSRVGLRVEDLNPGADSVEVAQRQIDDLARLGLDWDGPVTAQHDHRSRFDTVIAALESADLTYPCFCSRREVLEAAVAPHGPSPEGAYPGTCRDLTPSEQADRARALGPDRAPALRLLTNGGVVTVDDRLHGPVSAVVDDFVLRRGDGVPSYNLAVVVDDYADGIEEVVRGDDLILSSPRQAYLARLMGALVPTYVHVPLVLGPDGTRLAKRDGAVTLADREALGETPDQVRSFLAASLGLAEPGEPATMAELLERFDPDRLPRRPWTIDRSTLGD